MLHWRGSYRARITGGLPWSHSCSSSQTVKNGSQCEDMHKCS